MNSFISSISGLLPIGIAAVASAESPSDSSSAVWWIVGAAGAAVIFNQLATAWTTLTGRFKERESSGPCYQRVETCEKLHNSIAASMNETEDRHSARTEALRQEIKRDIGGVHVRIDEVLKAVSRVEGKVNQ